MSLGVTRSRTLLFFSYRDSAPRKSLSRRFNKNHNNNTSTTTFFTVGAAEDDDEDDERHGLIPKDHDENNDAGASVSLDMTLPPKWVDISEQVEQIIASLLPKISALDKLHAKHVLPGFTDRSAEEREIQSITNDITRDFRRCQTLIQQVPAADSQSSQPHSFPPKPTGPLSKPAQNVQRALAAKVQELSSTFRKKQRVYMERLQGHSIKHQDILLASGQVRLRGQEGISALEDDVKASQTTTNVPPSPSQSQTLITTQTQEDTLLTHRNQEIAQIADSITQLAELFKDLSTLVIDQGTILDSVEYNIEQTLVDLDHAHEDLLVGEKYQKRTGRRACIFLLLLIIVGLILVLIFKPRRRHVASTEPPSSPSMSARNSIPFIIPTL